MSRPSAMSPARKHHQTVGTVLLAAALMAGIAAPASASASVTAVNDSASTSTRDLGKAARTPEAERAMAADRARAAERPQVVAPAHAADEDVWFPSGVADKRSKGQVHAGLDHAAACAGGFAVEDHPGTPDARHCTHGPDQAPAGVDVRQVPTTADLAASVTAVAEEAAGAAEGSDTVVPGAVPCTGDGTSGKRVQVIYAVASDKVDRYASVVELLRTYAYNADQTFASTAARDGGVRHLRWVTDAGCKLVVDHVVLSPTGDDTIGNTRSELTALGYKSVDRKYLVFADAAVYCGIAYTVSDTQPGSANAANRGPTFARVDSACWGASASVAAHEIAHTLGAVQLSAPHANGAWHCTDEYDRMCYNDGSGKPMTYPCASSQEPVFDCGGDDYFSLNPTPGSWLATHWNLADSTFLDGATPKVSVGDPSVAEGSVGTTSLTFPVTLSVPASTGASVTVATASGTGDPLTDYAPLAATQVAFAPGEFTKSVTVSVTGDGVTEADETVRLELSGPVGMTMGDGSGTGTIVNDDGLPSVYVSDTSVLEGDSGSAPGAVTVSLSTPAPGPVSVTYATANGSAVVGQDYTALSARVLTFAVGETSKTLPVTVLGDSRPESPESFSVKLSTPVGAVLGDAVGTVNILGEEGPLALYVGDPYVVEGSAGTTSLAFPVTLSGAATTAVTTKVATTDGTALAGSDYTALPSTTLTFAAGETSKVVSVPMLGDATAESNETIRLNLTSPVGAVIADTSGTGTIVNDDGAAPVPPVPSVFVSDTSLVEGASGSMTGSVTVSLSAAAATNVAVTYATANGSAVAGSDYTAAAATVVTFAPGQTSQTVPVTVLGDALAESSESFSVKLSAPVGVLLGDAVGTVNILGEEGPLTVHVGDPQVMEGGAGAAATLAYRVTLSAAPAPGTSVSVKVVTANGTATSGSDYTAHALTTLTFAAGEATKVVPVAVTGDVTPEPSETVLLNLSAPVGAVLADAGGTGTIVNDD